MCYNKYENKSEFSLFLLLICNEIELEALFVCRVNKEVHVYFPRNFLCSFSALMKAGLYDYIVKAVCTSYVTEVNMVNRLYNAYGIPYFSSKQK